MFKKDVNLLRQVLMNLELFQKVAYNEQVLPMVGHLKNLSLATEAIEKLKSKIKTKSRIANVQPGTKDD